MPLHEISLRTDFNEIYGGLAYGLIGHANAVPLVPEVGEEVILYDGEGNTCRGIVRTVMDNGVIGVELDEATWRSPVTIPNIDVTLGLHGGQSMANGGVTSSTRSAGRIERGDGRDD